MRVAIDGVDLVCDRYCKRVYDSDPTMRSTIFHTLLRIYLRPRADHPVLFAPALSLLSTHAARIDAIEAFELLPPLVALEDIQVYLTKTLRRSVEKRREAKMVRAVGKSAVDQAEGEVVDLEERRVKITEGRLCVPTDLSLLVTLPLAKGERDPGWLIEIDPDHALSSCLQLPGLPQTDRDQRDRDPQPSVRCLTLYHILCRSSRWLTRYRRFREYVQWRSHALPMSGAVPAGTRIDSSL